MLTNTLQVVFLSSTCTQVLSQGHFEETQMKTEAHVNIFNQVLFQAPRPQPVSCLQDTSITTHQTPHLSVNLLLLPPLFSSNGMGILF